MLGLAVPSDPAWLARALAHLDDVLVDHAHCEKKAASTVVSLLFRYPERTSLLAPLAVLAREELEHFERTLALLAQRGVAYRRLTPSPYATALLAAARAEEPGRLVDTLCCMALIEARSCERMKLLADAVDDAELAAFYRGLLAAEARHAQQYLDLAATVVPAAAVRERFAALAAHEASILAAAPPLARMHAG